MLKKIKEKIIPGAIIVFILMLIAVTPMVAYAGNQPLAITVRQSFSDSSNSTEATFSYILKPLDSDNPMPAGSTAEGYRFSIFGENSKEMDPINFTREGLFEYELYKVIEAGKQGYTFDRRKYTLEVYVDSTLDPLLVIFAENGIKANSIVFLGGYNTLPTDPKLMTDPLVKKKVTGNPRNRGTFTFKLAARNSSYPMPEGSKNGVKTIRVTAPGEGEFGTWSYAKTGTYYYSVFEEDTRESGYTYDKAVYTITDKVSDKDGQLVLSRTVTNSKNKKVDDMEFVNKYSKSSDNDANAGKEGGGGGSSGGGGGGATAKTGDDMRLALYITLLALSAAFVIGLVVYLKRRNRGNTAA